MMAIEPITREEMYLAAAAGYSVTPPDPVTRKEMFLARLAGMELETPNVLTRKERFLEEAAAATNRSVIEPLEVTENGTYTAPEGVDGYSPVTVDVPSTEIKLQEKTITENGEYTADSGFDGLSKVLVNVADSGGGSQVANHGVFNANGTVQTIEHGLGVTPDFIFLYSPLAMMVSGGANVMALGGYSSAFRAKYGTDYCELKILRKANTTTLEFKHINLSVDYGTEKSGLIWGATETTFNVPAELESRKEYNWIAVAGLV